MTNTTPQITSDGHEASIMAEYKLLDQFNDSKGLYQPFFRTHQADPCLKLRLDTYVRNHAAMVQELKSRSNKIKTLKDENILLKKLLEDAVKELATADPKAANKWINRLAISAPFLAAIAFGTATIGGIAASLGFSAVAINELTRER